MNRKVFITFAFFLQILSSAEWPHGCLILTFCSLLDTLFRYRSYLDLYIYNSVVVNPIMFYTESNRADKKPDQRWYGCKHPGCATTWDRHFVTKERGKLPEIRLPFNDLLEGGKWVTSVFIENQIRVNASFLSPSVKTSGIKSASRWQGRESKER